MRLAPLFFAAALLMAHPLHASPAITVEDGYATSAGAMAVAGAAYFTLRNTGTEADRLIRVESDAAKRVMLHATVADGAVMGMKMLGDGIAVPAGGTHQLKPGGDHVMLMGLTAPLDPGATVMLTLQFEKAGAVTVEVRVAPIGVGAQ